MVFIPGNYVFYSLPVGVCFFHIPFPPDTELRRRYEEKELFEQERTIDF
jgi:hypothetical protein